MSDNKDQKPLPRPEEGEVANPTNAPAEPQSNEGDGENEPEDGEGEPDPGGNNPPHKPKDP